MINMNCEMQLEENRNPLPMDNQMCKLGVTFSCVVVDSFKV